MKKKVIDLIYSYLKTFNFLAFIFTGLILISIILFTIISYVNLSNSADLNDNLKLIIILLLVVLFFYFNFLTITSNKVSTTTGLISLFYILGITIGGSIMFTLIGVFIFSIFF